MVWFGECYTECSLVSIFIIIQAGVTSKWTNDSQHFLLEHFDIINNSPSHIYHSALPFSPSSSWLHKYYSAELLHKVKVVKGLPAEWGMCSQTVVLNSFIQTVSYHNNAVAVGSESGDIIILNAVTGSQTAVLSGHTKRVDCVTFSSDGTSLVSGSDDYTVKLWDVQTGGVVRTFSGHTGNICSVSISGDYITIASGSRDRTLRLWDIQTGVCHHTIEQPDAVLYVSFSPTDPKHLISQACCRVWHWDIDGHQIKPPCDGTCIAFSSDGNQFVSCNGVTVTIQNSNSGVMVAKFWMANSDAQYCCFSPNDKLVAIAVSNNVYILDITSSEPHLVETFIGHTNKITSLTFSSPSSLISVSCDGSVKFWQIGTSSSGSVVIDSGSTSITSPSIWSVSLQAGIVISSDTDGLVKTWDISTGLCKTSFQTPAKNSDKRDIQLINSRLIIVWYAEGKIRIWDVEKGELLSEADVPRPDVLDLRISGDGSKIFCLTQEYIEAWDVWTGEAAGSASFFECPGAEFFAVDGSKVWISLAWGEPQGWDFKIPGPSYLGFSTMPPDRPHPKVTKLWDYGLSRVKDTITGKVVFQLPARFGSPVDVQWNGQYLATCLGSKEVLVLEFHPTVLK